MKAGPPEPSKAERWHQAKAIVADALEEKSRERRAALVAERCAGDPLLFREVESLLEQTTAVFEEFAVDAAARRDMPLLDPGRRLGAYAITREIGRGGMGAVYLAQRADGAFEKQVAVKVLKRGTDTDEILRRFEAERQILARLDNPNIARLIDAGTTDDGLPYVVMDYVAGKPITQYAREKQLSVVDRLKLFRAVCSAVSYAHQNLVVHRDLKPGNILVTENDEVRLLDFGIAKLLSDAEAGGADMTITVLRIMTPEYASPEQVKGDPITTVSDVYSLGVILYELVTGTRPYKLARKTPEELSKAICEQEPERPSTAFAKGDGNSKLEIRNSKILKGDLDNIVLKALRKEPPRRYASVDQFSDDIRRYLEGLPVLARKDTLSYRTGKFVVRHKFAVAAAALFLLVLIGGVIAASWEARRARLAEVKAEQRFAEVRQLAHSILFDYHDEIAALPGSTKVRARLVKDALTYLDNLSRESENDRTLLRELATAYEKLASVQGGITNTNTAVNSGLVTVSNLGDTKGALETQLKATALWERLSRLQPGDPATLADLAGAYSVVGFIHQTLGAPEKAVAYNQKTVQLCEPLLAADPNNEALQFELVAAYITISKALGNPGTANLGDKAGALAYKDKAQALAEKLVADHPAKSNYAFALASLHNMANLMATDTKISLGESSKAADIFAALVKANPDNAFFRRELAIELGNIGSVLLVLRDNANALEKIKEAQVIYDALVQADPNDASIRGSAAMNLRKLGAAQGANGDHAAAFATFQKAQQIFAELVAQDPGNAEFRRQWAYAYLAMSRDQLAAGNFAGAIESATQGVRIEEKLVTDSPTNANAQNTLALLYVELGDSDEKQAATTQQKESWQAAKVAYGKGLALYQSMKSKGTLGSADAGKLDELATEISKCDAALH